MAEPSKTIPLGELQVLTRFGLLYQIISLDVPAGSLYAKCHHEHQVIRLGPILHTKKWMSLPCHEEQGIVSCFWGEYAKFHMLKQWSSLIRGLHSECCQCHAKLSENCSTKHFAAHVTDLLDTRARRRPSCDQLKTHKISISSSECSSSSSSSNASAAEVSSTCAKSEEVAGP